MKAGQFFWGKEVCRIVRTGGNDNGRGRMPTPIRQANAVNGTVTVYACYLSLGDDLYPCVLGCSAQSTNQRLPTVVDVPHVVGNCELQLCQRRSRTLVVGVIAICREAEQRLDKSTYLGMPDRLL